MTRRASRITSVCANRAPGAAAARAASGSRDAGECAGVRCPREAASAHVDAGVVTAVCSPTPIVVKSTWTPRSVATCCSTCRRIRSVRSSEEPSGAWMKIRTRSDRRRRSSPPPGIRRSRTWNSRPRAPEARPRPVAQGQVEQPVVGPLDGAEVPRLLGFPVRPVRVGTLRKREHSMA